MVTARCDATAGKITALRARLETMPLAKDASFLKAYDGLNNLMSMGGAEASVVSETNHSKPVRDAAEACVQKIGDLSTGIGLSRPIYDRLAAIDGAKLDLKTRYVLERRLRAYRQTGVDRDAATRARVEALQNEITATGLSFARNIREQKGEILLDSAADLAGLPQDDIDAHKHAADGRIHISTDYPDALPVLEYAGKEDVRRRMLSVFDNRAYPDNKAVLEKILAKRRELATLLGYRSYAHLVTEDKMIGTPERAAAFIDDLDGAAKAPLGRTGREAVRLRAPLRVASRANSAPCGGGQAA